MNFGRQMRVMRVARKRMLQDVARETGIDISTLSRYERGLEPTDAHRKVILEKYGFPPEGLREVAFGIIEGVIDRPAAVMEALSNGSRLGELERWSSERQAEAGNAQEEQR